MLLFLQVWSKSAANPSEPGLLQSEASYYFFYFFCYGYILVLISWFNTGSSGKSRNVSISFRFSNIECRSWNHALILFWISLVDVVMFICSFLDLSICLFSFFSYYLGRNSVHLLYLLEDSAFRFPYFLYFFLYSINFCSDFYYFLTLTGIVFGLFLFSPILELYHKPFIYVFPDF